MVGGGWKREEDGWAAGVEAVVLGVEARGSRGEGGVGEDRDVMLFSPLAALKEVCWLKKVGYWRRRVLDTISLLALRTSHSISSSSGGMVDCVFDSITKG